MSGARSRKSQHVEITRDMLALVEKVRSQKRALAEKKRELEMLDAENRRLRFLSDSSTASPSRMFSAPQMHRGFQEVVDHLTLSEADVESGGFECRISECALDELDLESACEPGRLQSSRNNDSEESNSSLPSAGSSLTSFSTCSFRSGKKGTEDNAAPEPLPPYPLPATSTRTLPNGESECRSVSKQIQQIENQIQKMERSKEDVTAGVTVMSIPSR